MMVRGWGGSAAVAVGVAGATGAAQLGLAYGTGVLAWPVEVSAAADQAWVASLTWGCWIAATSTIVGAVVAARLRPVGEGSASPGQERLTHGLWRLALAVGAAVGAMITVALIAVPAREAVAAVAAAPQAVAAGYAVLGVGLGLLLAVGALAARAVAANVLATAAWLWLLAVAVVVDGVVRDRQWSSVPLGFADVDLGELWFRSIMWPDAGVALAAAFLIGALAALPAARRGDRPVGVASSGAAGPLVLAVSYLLAQPELTSVGALELSRYLVVPYAVLAGLAGSLLVSAVPRRGDRRDDQESDAGPGWEGAVPEAERATPSTASPVPAQPAPAASSAPESAEAPEQSEATDQPAPRSSRRRGKAKASQQASS